MKISKFKISKDLAEKKGLKEVDLTKKPLGSVVALAGINGSGKSRILEFVRDFHNTLMEKELVFEDYIDGIPQNTNNLFLDFKSNIESLKQLEAKRAITFDTMERFNMDQQITNLAVNQNKLKAQIGPTINQTKELLHNHVKYVSSKQLKELNKALPTNTSFKNLVTSAINNPNEFDYFSSESTIQYIIELCTDIVEGKFDLLSDEEDVSKVTELDSHKKFDSLKKILEKLLNKRFSFKRKKNLNRIIAGEFIEIDTNKETPFDYEKLSAGEKTLFAFGILLFFQEIGTNSKLKDSIIIIDEPELNLHPDAQIKVLDRLRELIGETGQLWIATHSLHILSHLKHDEIIFVDNGEVEHPSISLPAKTYKSLMGTEEHIHKLTQFVSSISDWTYANYIVDCFNDPDVIPWSNAADPQVTVFTDALKNKSNIKLLDYGAGKGRVRMAITNNETLNDKIEYYYALEIEENIEKLKQIPNIKQVYSEKEELPQNTFDFILLCNVLHEIEPQKWAGIFRRIQKSLNDTGSLIIIEDRFLPKGERANKYGFLLLDIPQLKILLGYDKDEEILMSTHPDNNYKERILCAVIPKEKIKIKEEQVLSALKDLEEKTYKKVKELRSKEGEKNSRLYAQFSQQYINAKIAIEDLSKK